MTLLPLCLDSIPAPLKARPQWVLWRGRDKQKADGTVGIDKVPYQADAPHEAKTNDPRTWATFRACCTGLPCALQTWEVENPAAYRGGGIGYVFSPDDPYTGVDLDKCVTAEGIEPWAQDIIDALDSYTEVSVSGTGVHILVEASLPAGGRKRGAIEMYDQRRYFTISGHHIEGTPTTIESRQEALDALGAEFFPPQAPPARPTASSLSLDDAAILDKARHARNGAKFSQLWEGNTNGYGSASEADLALCSMLTFYCGGPDQVDRLFRQSGLLREKWDTRRGNETYGQQTVQKAWTEQREHYRTDEYSPHRNGSTATTESLETERPPGNPVALPWSDYVNALTFVREHGANVRYCYPWKSWLVWTGTHWERDTSGAVMQMAKLTIKQLARRAEVLQEEELKALLSHIKSSLSTAKLKAMIESAQSEPGIPVKPEDLDTHPWLLNCQNGTLDLRTGALGPHDRGHLLTKCLAIAYDPESRYPAWSAFLERILGGNPDLILFVQRAIGYSLTGSTREQCLFILHGPTKTGKSTFLATIRALLGPYGQQADMSSFMHKDNEEVRNDLADLAGSRLVCALESQEGKRLAESLVKQLTGGVDLIKARFLFQEHFTFRPQFKLFLGTNHKPLIRDTDSAIWERIRLIPFVVHIPKPERDKALDDKLQQELPGILAWAVRGCMQWQTLGELQEPHAVLDATAEYRAEMDTIARFLDECCIEIDNRKLPGVKASALASAYLGWCKRTGELPMPNRTFIKDLEDRQYTRKRGTGNHYYWHGLGLVNTDDDHYSPQ